MDFSIVASIIVSLISVIGSFVVVYLSAIRDVFSEKQQVRREQLDNFYIPFLPKILCWFSISQSPKPNEPRIKKCFS